MELILLAADKLVLDKPEQKQQRKLLFSLVVSLASSKTFAPDTLKQGFVFQVLRGFWVWGFGFRICGCVSFVN